MNTETTAKTVTIVATAVIAAAPAAFLLGTRFATGIRRSKTVKKAQAFVNVTNQILAH